MPEDKRRVHGLDALVVDEAGVIVELRMVVTVRCHWLHMPHAFTLVDIDLASTLACLLPWGLLGTSGIMVHELAPWLGAA